jgi:hypothetical protein
VITILAQARVVIASEHLLFMKGCDACGLPFFSAFKRLNTGRHFCQKQQSPGMPGDQLYYSMIGPNRVLQFLKNKAGPECRAGCF